MKTFRTLFFGVGMVWLTHVNGVAQACEACLGKSDAPMAHGMNAGVMALLGVITTVLCGAATFFVFLARRAAAVAKIEESSKV